LGRTDTRWGVGPSGEIFILNKHDGMVRRIAGVVGFPDPPHVPVLSTWGVVLLAGCLAAIGWVALRGAGRRAAA
jgi:hypothetical protein